MSKKRKHNWTRMGVQRAHIALGRVDAPDLAVSSCKLDASADRRWFLDHPRETERERPPTLLERAALGLPDGTIVTVKKLKGGEQMRIFSWPQPLAALPDSKRA